MREDKIVLSENSNTALDTEIRLAAFDNFFFGIRPDFVIEVRRDVLEETDGPMLRHGLQGLHKIRLLIPRKLDLRPDPELLERRWIRFEEVA